MDYGTAYAHLQLEQARLRDLTCEVLGTDREESLPVIRAIPHSKEQVGQEFKFFDSPKTRELLKSAGYLMSDGRSFDRGEYPGLFKFLCSDRAPYRNPNS